jgi:biotin carboxyl carrier protein
MMKSFENLETLKLYTGFYRTRLSTKFRNKKEYRPEDPHLIHSFIPGTIIDVLVKPGQVVNRGDSLMILDAMKMQNHLKCKMDGKVKKILVVKGDKVPKGAPLLEME